MDVADDADKHSYISCCCFCVHRIAYVCLYISHAFDPSTIGPPRHSLWMAISPRWRCEIFWSACLSVCMFVRLHIPNAARPNCTTFSMYDVTRGRGSVLCRHWDTLCTSGFVDDVICLHNAGNNRPESKTARMICPVRQVAAGVGAKSVRPRQKMTAESGTCAWLLRPSCYRHIESLRKRSLEVATITWQHFSRPKITHICCQLFTVLNSGLLFGCRYDTIDHTITCWAVYYWPAYI